MAGSIEDYSIVLHEYQPSFQWNSSDDLKDVVGGVCGILQLNGGYTQVTFYAFLLLPEFVSSCGHCLLCIAEMGL